jgi:hypothetical protein
MTSIRSFRFKQTQDSTVSRLFAGGFECNVLEDGHRDVKEYGKTRIPAGTYKLTLRTHGGFYDRYTKLYKAPHPMIQLVDVPGFEDVLIHRGNAVDDTKGCLLLGMRFDLTNGVYRISESEKAYNAFRAAIQKDIDAAPKNGGVVGTIEIKEDFTHA